MITSGTRHAGTDTGPRWGDVPRALDTTRPRREAVMFQHIAVTPRPRAVEADQSGPAKPMYPYIPPIRPLYTPCPRGYLRRHGSDPPPAPRDRTPDPSPGPRALGLDDRARIWSLGVRALGGRGAVRRGCARGVAWSVRLLSVVPGTRNHRDRLASASWWTRYLIATRASRGPIAWESGGNGPGTLLGKWESERVSHGSGPRPSRDRAARPNIGFSDPPPSPALDG